MGGDVGSQKASHNAEEETLNDINDEIMSLYEYLEKHGVSGREYTLITQPLVDIVMKQSPASSERHGLSKFTKGIAEMLFCCIIFYLFFQVEYVHKICGVLTRNTLLLLLPWWDWSKIYYSDCVLTNPYYVSRTLSEDDCNVCESLEGLDHISNISTKVVTEDYLKNDVPFIVTDAMDGWPVMNTDDFWFDNITELYMSEEQRHIYPCELTTNLRLRPDDLRSFLNKIHNPDIRRWYGHWENCDKKAAKALRPLYQRPYFIPHMVDLSDSNWVLLSSNFKGKVYKELDYQTELLWVGQVRGWSRIRLVPREPCDHYCPELSDVLMEGHMAVLTNILWKFEYIPGEHTDNLAIAVGGFWN